MSEYAEELLAARRRGRAAYEAMETWVSRPLDAPDLPGEVLEDHAKVLRESREAMRQLRRDHGVRDDIDAALAENEEHHRLLGLSLRGESDPEAGGA